MPTYNDLMVTRPDALDSQIATYKAKDYPCYDLREIRTKETRRAAEGFYVSVKSDDSLHSFFRSPGGFSSLVNLRLKKAGHRKFSIVGMTGNSCIILRTNP